MHNSDQKGSHWMCSYKEQIIPFSYSIAFGVGHIPNNIYNIYKKFNIITNIYRIQDIYSNLCGLFCVLFILYKVNNKNRFIEVFKFI